MSEQIDEIMAQVRAKCSQNAILKELNPSLTVAPPSVESCPVDTPMVEPSVNEQCQTVPSTSTGDIVMEIDGPNQDMKKKDKKKNKKKNKINPNEDEEVEIPVYKILMVGPLESGKTSIILQYLYKEYSRKYEPTKADSYRADVMIDGKKVILDILDVSGKLPSEEDMKVYIQRSEGFMLVYNITQLPSYKEASQIRERVLEIKGEEEEHVPMVFVGNRLDIEFSNRMITTEDALKKANEWNVPYVEVSARKAMNIDECFVQMARELEKAKTATNKNDKKDKSKMFPKMKMGKIGKRIVPKKVRKVAKMVRNLY